MRKIPTLYVRDETDRRYVTDAVTPGCEWVLAGEGVATRKYDGTCVMFDGASWWARREVKPGKAAPEQFVSLGVDDVTGKTVGWEPVEQSAFARWHAEAVATAEDAVEDSEAWQPGTYEMCGPRVNGDPERYGFHMLIRHDDAQRVRPFSLTFDGIRDTLTALAPMEGLVWHHPDGRMAKIKARDFRNAPSAQ